VASDGSPMLVLHYMPSMEDMEAMAAGRPIILVVAAKKFPPITLITTDENGIPNI
jgi:hypothetical protein